MELFQWGNQSVGTGDPDQGLLGSSLPVFLGRHRLHRFPRRVRGRVAAEAGEGETAVRRKLGRVSLRQSSGIPCGLAYSTGDGGGDAGAAGDRIFPDHRHPVPVGHHPLDRGHRADHLDSLPHRARDLLPRLLVDLDPSGRHGRGRAEGQAPDGAGGRRDQEAREVPAGPQAVPHRRHAGGAGRDRNRARDDVPDRERAGAEETRTCSRNRPGG